MAAGVRSELRARRHPGGHHADSAVVGPGRRGVVERALAARVLDLGFGQLFGQCVVVAEIEAPILLVNLVDKADEQ